MRSTYSIYHSPEMSPPADQDARLRRLPADDLLSNGSAHKGPGVLIVDRSLLGRIANGNGLPRHITIVAADYESEEALRERAQLSLVGLVDPAARSRVLRAASQLSEARLLATQRRRELARTRCDLRRLKRIGMALMHERDLDVLLQRIIEQGKRLTDSDAGGLLLLEKDRRGVPHLRMAMYEFDSLPDLPPLTEARVPVDNTSIVGHAASIKQTVVIDDAYDLPPNVGFVRNPAFDLRFGYRIRSMLVVPMVDHRDGVVGVLVFINRKSDPTARITSKQAADLHVLSYTRRDVRVARALASQAAVSIENARLHTQVEQLLKRFIKAAVSAIDQRDPSTAGHSVRVATLTTDLAAAVERGGGGVYRDTRFTRAQMRELYYAALLHDLGKVGVSEDVLTKSKKLPAYLWERVSARFDLIRRTQELESYRRRARSDAHTAPRAISFDEELREQRAELERMWSVILAANEPADHHALAPALYDIAKHAFEGPAGDSIPYLTADELRFLEIPHGTLDARERHEIESHVAQTYQFLIQVPWTDDLKNMPMYAYGHHERLDGTGYPRRLRGDEIPIQTRLLTIADIFDALTESDRPYRRALPTDQALALLEADARAGLVDAELVRVMIQSRVYQRITEGDWRKL